MKGIKITEKGAVEITGVKAGIVFGAFAFFIMLSVLAYNAGYFSGAKIVTQQQKCTLGSALITNHPESLACWDPMKEGVYINMSNQASDLDIGTGYLTIRADEGCLQMITVTARTGNTSALTVMQASPSKEFMAADYEDWPYPPKFLAEDSSVTFEYSITVEAPNGWANTSVQNFTLYVDIPQLGEPMPGCSRDIGDGVCEWNSRIWVKSLAFNDTMYKYTGNSFVDGNITCSVNETGFIPGTTPA